MYEDLSAQRNKFYLETTFTALRNILSGKFQNLTRRVNKKKNIELITKGRDKKLLGPLPGVGPEHVMHTEKTYLLSNILLRNIKDT